MSMSLIRVGVLAVVALVVPSLAGAATLNLSQVGGTWRDAATAGGRGGALAGTGTSAIAWGTPATRGAPQSAYGFDGGDGAELTAPGQVLLGRFDHQNGTIWSRSTELVHADLDLSLAAIANGRTFSLDSSFRFSHDETLNPSSRCARGTATPCGDGVGIAGLSGRTLTLEVGGDVFTISIDGFVESLGGPVVSSLFTPEGERRSLYLQASLAVTPAIVPLPAAAPLLASALALLGLARRRA